MRVVLLYYHFFFWVNFLSLSLFACLVALLDDCDSIPLALSLCLTLSLSLSLSVCVCVCRIHIPCCFWFLFFSYLIFCFLMCTKPNSCLSRDDKRVVVVVGGAIAFSLLSLIFLDSFLLLLALCVCTYRDFTCPVLFIYSRPFGFDSFSLCFW